VPRLGGQQVIFENCEKSQIVAGTRQNDPKSAKIADPKIFPDRQKMNITRTGPN
jgi:hypothetical protein